MSHRVSPVSQPSVCLASCLSPWPSKPPAIAAHPEQLIRIIVPLVLLYLFNYILSTAVGRTLLPRGDAIALVYGTVMRNLSIALAVSINAFGPAGSDAALVIAIAYVIQVAVSGLVCQTDRSGVRLQTSGKKP